MLASWFVKTFTGSNGPRTMQFIGPSKISIQNLLDGEHSFKNVFAWHNEENLTLLGELIRLFFFPQTNV